MRDEKKTVHVGTHTTTVASRQTIIEQVEISRRTWHTLFLFSRKNFDQNHKENRRNNRCLNADPSDYSHVMYTKIPVSAMVLGGGK